VDDNTTNSGEQNPQGAAVPPEATVANQQAQDANQAPSVPLSALEAERSKRQQMEEENRLFREHIALMQANASRPQAQPVQPVEDEGLQDGDVMTYGDFKKHANKIAGQFQMTLEELKMTQQHPDYQDVISRYLPEVFKTNPSLRDSLRKSQDYDLAYYLAKNSDAYKAANTKAARNEDAERIIKNSQSAGTLSSLGAASPVVQARRYKDMSDEDFSNLVAQNLG
jgi:hypothetical protein